MTSYIKKDGLHQKVNGEPKPRQQAVCTNCVWEGPLRTKSRFGTRLVHHDLDVHTNSERHTEGK